MPVIVNGKQRHLTHELKRPPLKHGTWTTRKFQFNVYGPTMISEVEKDLDRICRHFNINKSTAFKLALRQTALAIENGRFKL